MELQSLRCRSVPAFALAGPALAVALAALAGCGGGRTLGVRTDIVPFSSEDRARLDEARDARYKLRVGDTFSVDFKYQDELDQQNITILPDGRFTMAGLEDVKAVGMTIPQVDSLITAHYAHDYRNPELSVLMQKLAEEKVYVLGEVESPGLYELPPGGEGVPQAITLAGGFKDGACRSDVVIMRVTEEGFLYRHCDLAHMEKHGLGSLDMWELRPFDVIYVPRSAVGDLAYFTNTVLGSVLDLSQLFWEVYAWNHLDMIDRVIR